MSALTFVDVAILFIRIIGTIIDAVAEQSARDAEIVDLAFEVVRAFAPIRGLGKRIYEIRAYNMRSSVVGESGFF